MRHNDTCSNNFMTSLKHDHPKQQVLATTKNHSKDLEHYPGATVKWETYVSQKTTKVVYGNTH